MRHRETRTHCRSWQRSAGMAARRARATAGDTGDRLSQPPVADTFDRNDRADFRRGLGETGYVEGQNVAVEYHWLEGHYDRIPTMLDDLVEHRVTVIAVAHVTTAALAAKSATRTIPIVFAVGSDPVAIGLVASLNRPGGNLTGISLQQTAAAAQRLELLHQIKPAERSIAFLVNPTNPSFAEAETKEVQVGGKCSRRGPCVAECKQRKRD